MSHMSYIGVRSGGSSMGAREHLHPLALLRKHTISRILVKIIVLQPLEDIVLGSVRW